MPFRKTGNAKITCWYLQSRIFRDLLDILVKGGYVVPWLYHSGNQLCTGQCYVQEITFFDILLKTP